MTSTSRRRGLAVALLVCAAIAATVRIVRIEQVSAENDRLFEYRVYHVLPGKLPALETRFRERTSKLLAKHGLNVVGFWTSHGDGAGDDQFIFMVAHRSREEADRNWKAMRDDPDFQELIRAEQSEKLVGKVDTTFLQPTDFSPLK